MYFTAFVVRQGLHVDTFDDVWEIALYNNRRVFIRHPIYDAGGHAIVPGDLIEFGCGPDVVNLEEDQDPGTVKHLHWALSHRIEDENTIRTFTIVLKTFQQSETEDFDLQEAPTSTAGQEEMLSK